MVKITNTYGKNAGKIWHVLNKHGTLTPTQLMKKTGLTREDLYTALGWLAKENKIIFDDNNFSLGDYNWNTTIGPNAGKVWDVVETCEEIDTKYIPKLADISDIDFYYAIGWLAKEGKIDTKKVRSPKSLTKISKK